MRAKWIISAVLLIAAGAIIFPRIQDRKVLVDTKTPEAETGTFVLEKDRSVLRSNWLAAARAVATKSANAQAQEVISFLEANNILVEPTVEGVKLLETSKDKNWFGFQLLVQGDGRISPVWEEMYTVANASFVANFNADVRMLVVKSHIPTSETWKGIVLLHEGNHALQCIMRRYDFHDPQVFCDEERDTHEFQNRITEKIGGERYTSFVNALSVELEEKLRKKGYKPGEVVYRRDRHFSELDDIFGPSESALERDFRETSVWIHASFIMLERAFGDQAPSQKSLFLKTLYNKSGVLSKK